MRSWSLRCLLALLTLLAAGGAPPASADVPFPRCADVPGCTDPSDYAAYLFVDPADVDLTNDPATGYPNDFTVNPADPRSGESWKFLPGTGMDILGAWSITTGRPDVVSAILDSGIRWNTADLRLTTALHTPELPLPGGCAEYDCNADGVVNVADYEGRDCNGTPITDANGNGPIDAQDLILLCSDGVDDDGNGFVDDIAGWDFQDDDNDAFDIVDYGHGTGEARDGMSEANNGNGFPGVAPSSMHIPLKVADSFVAVDSEFQQAVVYAVDRGVDIISEALGTIAVNAGTQEAIDYAYENGIPIIASAADEESRHHNWPANYEHTIWVNSIVHGDGTIVEEEDTYDLLNGCTNHGGRAWVAISSNSCSSEATGRANGMTSLLIAHGKNLMDEGLLSPYPGLAQPFSAEEIRQLFRTAADDIDHSDDRTLTLDFLVQIILAGNTPETDYVSQRFASQPGWDEFFGYGRPDTVALLSVTEGTIPPEADLSGGLRWFDIVDPVRTPTVDVVGSAAANRRGGPFTYTVEVGCGVSPAQDGWTELGGGVSNVPLDETVLASWDPAQTASDCGFDPSARVGAALANDADAYSVTVRLTVVDDLGNDGVDRRTVAIHTDATQRFAPKYIGASGEGSPVLADLDGDGAQEIIYGSGDGAVHAFRGATGEEMPGFPVFTDPLPVHASPGYATGRVPVPHESIIAPVAAGDLDRDGRVEIVVTSMEGKLYVFGNHGERRTGFPVSTFPAFSDPANRDRHNDTDPAIVSAPTLADLDGPNDEPNLEIVHGAWDGHLYAWRSDGSLVDGFPVRLADTSRVSVDAATGKSTPTTDGVESRGAKILSSPAVGDLDGDGWPEIVAATTEEYVDLPPAGGGDPPLPFATTSTLVGLLLNAAGQLGFDDLSVDTQGRAYAVNGRGNAHPDGPFLAGWPVKVPLLTPGLLPTVGTGTTGAPALADLDGNGTLTTAIFSIAGPVMLFNPDGSPRQTDPSGIPLPLDVDFPAPGFPLVPATAGSQDGPFFAALGSGAFGDITGDGAPEYVAPTAGIHKLIDVVAPAQQVFGDHQITAWNPLDGSVLPAFPRFMDDMQFLSSPCLADVSGDGVPDVVQGSGVYMVRAYESDGATPADWPKFTHGWLIPSPVAGDVDGDGLIEVASFTREGHFFVWDTPAPAVESAIAWQGFGADRHNSQNAEAGVPRTATGGDPLAGLLWDLEALALELQDVLAAPGLQPGATLANVANVFAVMALMADNVDFAVAMVPFIESGLAEDGLDDLHAHLMASLARAAAGVVASIDCGGDPACEAELATAQWYLNLADWFADAGDTDAAIFLWSRVLRVANAG